MLGAAGAVEAIIAVLALCSGVDAAHGRTEGTRPECDWIMCRLSRKADPAVALSVSIGFGGHNACVAFKDDKLAIFTNKL